MSRSFLFAGALALCLNSAPTALAQSSFVEPMQIPFGSSRAVDRASESPAGTTADTAYVAGLYHQEGNWYLLDVYSPSMGRVIRNNLLLAPGDEPRPTLYLLQGSEGGANNDDWPHQTSYRSFFADKQVNVVSALGGEGSLFLDWPRTDPSIGTSQWVTYYGKELPSIMESVYHSNEKRAVAGMSMAGGAALNIAAQFPGRYLAAASLSGYSSLSSPMGRLVGYSMALAHKAHLSNALGWPDDPRWAVNDPILNLEALRGVDLFFSSGGSIPQRLEVMKVPTAWEGIPAEVPSRLLSDAAVARARQAGLYVTYSRDLNGLHYWPYFEQSLYKAWDTTIAPAFAR